MGKSDLLLSFYITMTQSEEEAAGQMTDMTYGFYIKPCKRQRDRRITRADDFRV